MIKKTCRGCHSNNLKQILSLGNSPLANNLLDKVGECILYPLNLNLCLDCFNCQLTYVVPPNKMFKKYLYVSSTTKSFREHFNKAAKKYTKKFNLNKDSFVIDIGSNDGIALKPLVKKDIKVLGIEPASNICKIATENGISTYCGYFDDKATNLIEQKADLITASNVFAHADDLESITKNAFKVLKEDGCFVVEVQYLLDTIKDLTFDNIYHEHVNYWSVTSINSFFNRLGFKVNEIEHINTHGGSIRVYVKRKEHTPHYSVKEFLEIEEKFGVNKLKTYLNFSKNISKRKKSLLTTLNKIKKEGHKIIGYGAPAKATTLLNSFNIDNSILSCIVDDNILKHNKIVPKVNIPIYSKENAIKKDTKYILILAWNFYKEIINNNKDLLNRGINFIVPTQEVKIINKENYECS